MEVQILWAMPVHLAQLVERQTFNLVVAGSSPAVDIKTFDSKEGNTAGLAQVAFGQTQTFHLWTWLERRTFNPEVPGSSPGVGTTL